MLIAISVVAVTFLGLTGCSSSNVLYVYNWGEYLSVGEDDMIDVNEEFYKETGIKVVYTTYPDNESMYAKIVSGSANYDIVIPSDYMISKMIDEDLLAELNYDNIPNFQYIDESFLNPEYDPENKYSVPYMWGTVGIFYNTTMVDEEDVIEMGWDILWSEKYAGKILMFNNPRDAFGIAELKLGYSLNTTDEDEIRAAANALLEQKSVVQAYVMDQIFTKMSSGEAAIAPYYAGDGVRMMEDNSDIAYYVPESGTNKFVDAICVLKTSKHKDWAEQYINFLCEKNIALANVEYVGYSTPLTTVYYELDDEVKNNPQYYPSDELLSKCEVFVNLPDETNELMNQLWEDVKMS